MNIINKCTSNIEQKTLILFARFLKEKKIYRKFLDYGNEYINYNGDVRYYGNGVKNVYDFLLLQVKFNPYRLISIFAWGRTKEGFDYWERMNNYEWNKTYNNLKFIKRH